MTVPTLKMKNLLGSLGKNYFYLIAFFMLASFPLNTFANADEVRCADGTYIGSTFTTHDFLELGSSSGSSNIGYLSSDGVGASEDVGHDTAGSPVSFACSISNNALIGGIVLTSANANPATCIFGGGGGAANLTGQYILIQGGNGTYYSVLHGAYGDWTGGAATITAQQCDATGNFDSATGCSIATTCSVVVSNPVNIPIFGPFGLLIMLLGLLWFGGFMKSRG